MLNKNVAEYTNFEGKTNKKILQAPGGSSSICLAWSNQKTDYGTKQQYLKAHIEQNLDYYSKPQGFNFSEPIRVMEVAPIQSNYKNTDSQQNGLNVGGSFGYNNYRNFSNNYKGNNYVVEQPKGNDYWKQQPHTSLSSSSRANRANHVEQLDLAVQEQKIQKNQREQRTPSISSMPKPQSLSCQGRSSIKINGPPRQNNIFAGNNYNYWKDYNNEHNFKQSKVPDNRIMQQQQELQVIKRNNENPQKTSIKINNYPGGKQTFTLG